MKRVLSLAERGRGYVSPNPMVGAVIVKDGRIVGQGYHKIFGGPHAEVIAIEKAGDDAAGSTLYVNLEPCCHQGKTGPCTERILQAGIDRVVVGMRDPNPRVNGEGVNFLRSKGITVREDVLQDKCRELNRAFVKYIVQHKPFVTLKIAQTLDGRIATSTGHSKWITAQQSRTMAHKIRANHDAILIGIGTLLTDDPKLTVRYSKGLSPKRIVLDSQLRVPLDAKILSADLAPGTIFISTELASKEKITRIQERGATVQILDKDDRGWVTFPSLWKYIADLGITSVLIEGGSSVQTECLKGSHADRLILFIAPKLLGTGIDAIGDLGIRNINSAIQLYHVQIKKLDEDYLLTAEFG